MADYHEGQQTEDEAWIRRRISVLTENLQNKIQQKEQLETQEKQLKVQKTKVLGKISDYEGELVLLRKDLRRLTGVGKSSAPPITLIGDSKGPLPD